MKTFSKIATLYVFLHYSAIASSSGDDLREKYLSRLSIQSTSIMCADKWFMKKAKLDQKSCIDKMLVYSKKCNSIIKPLVPDFANEDEPKNLVNIGKLYSYCIKTQAYEREESN